jgi:nucleoside-diphosphate-sugar epimerase
MRVFVDGAAGFLGRHVVRALAERGHIVRAFVRSLSSASADFFPPGTELVTGDLLQSETVRTGVRGADAVVHLAICKGKNAEVQLADTVQGTSNLCDAMAAEGVGRIVHCSSLAVYDYGRVTGMLDETSPLEAKPKDRDDYAQAKIAQEERIRKFTADHNWTTTILRPGFIWGPGRIELAGWGYSIGPVSFIVAGNRLLPMTYVENCADCFALAIERKAAAGEAFNIVDDDLPTAGQYIERLMKSNHQRGLRINLPFGVGLGVAGTATAINRSIFAGRLKLPGLLVAPRYRARFSPIGFSNRKAKELLDWMPHYDFQQAWARAIGTQANVEVNQQAGPAPQEVVRGS